MTDREKQLWEEEKAAAQLGIKVLPKIPFEGKEYTFDQRLCELRIADPKAGFEFIKLRESQCELLAIALGLKDKRIIKFNMQEIMETKVLGESCLR
jgi:hypothetical protein